MSKRRFLENFSVQRGTPRESDTASRREEACLVNPCNVVAQLVTSRPVTCFSCTDVLGPSRITRKQLASPIVHSALLHVLRSFPLLQGEKKTKLLNDMSTVKPSELWKMAVDDRVRSLLKSVSSQKGKGKGKGKGKKKRLTPRSCTAFTKITMDPCG